MTDTLRTIAMAAGVIVLAGIAAWMGLAHGCQAPVGEGVVAGRVTIAPELKEHVADTDVLYVIVRRPQGPRRPVAVQRIDRPRFPVEFQVTRDDVMIEGVQLQGMVEVIARLDKDGNAGPPQPGDLEGHFAHNPTLVGGQEIEIELNMVH